MRIAAFKFLCNSLTPIHDEENTDRLRRIISEKAVSWPEVIKLANAYLVSTGLWNSLKTKGLLVDLEDDVRCYLHEVNEMNQWRNEQLRRQTLETICKLNEVGITPLLLKGAGQLFRPIHGQMGNRIISDLDILIPAEQIEVAFERLIKQGYCAYRDHLDYSKHHHLCPLVKPGEYGCIELHRQALVKNVSHVLPTSFVWQDARQLTVERTSFCLPSVTHDILIGLLHSQIGHRCYCERQFDLRALYDLSATKMCFSAAIDWDEINDRMNDQGLGYALEAYIFAAHRLFHLRPPPNFNFGSRTRLHHLVCLAANRWSHVDRLLRRYSTYRISKIYGWSR